MQIPCSGKKFNTLRGLKRSTHQHFTNQRAKEIKLPKLYIAISDKEQITTSVGLGMNSPTFTN